MTRLNDEGFMDNHEEAIPEWSHLDAMAVIEKVIYKQLGEESMPYARCILGIMQSAGDENDLDYFGSSAFSYHCMLIGLDADDILQTIVRKRLLSKKVTTHHNYKTIVDEEDKIRWMYEMEGVSQGALAEMYNVSPPTIRKLLSGAYAPKIAFNGLQDQIIEDYLFGIPTKELMHMYNLSETSLYRALENTPKIHSRGRPSRTVSLEDETPLYKRNNP